MRYLRPVILCLILLMVTPMFYSSVLAEEPDDGRVAYSRATTIYPVMNGESYTDSSFLKTYVGADSNSIYNIAPAFRQESSSKGASSMPEYLTFGTAFSHKDNDNTYEMHYKYEFEEALRPARVKGDLYLSYAATLTNDRHWNIKRHVETWTAYPTTWIQTYNRTLIKHETSGYNNDMTVTLGKNQFVPIGSGRDHRLFFGALGQICSCGSSKVAQMSTMLADVVGPKVNSIYTTRLRSDGVMEPFSHFAGGDTAYINLRFDENIRFASDETMALDDAPKLKLRLKRIVDNVEETGITAEATLISLSKDTLTFAYVIPASFDVGGQTVAANHYIYAVEPYDKQISWISSSAKFDLKLFGKQTGQVNYLTTTRKSTSLIVDLAGNPIVTGGSTVMLQAPTYVDSLGPVVKRLDLVRTTAPTNPLQLNSSDVFAKVGEQSGFLVYFSEGVLLRRSDGALVTPENGIAAGGRLGYDMQNPFAGVYIRIVAELNVSKSGKPITAVAKNMTYVQDGKSGPMVSAVYFELEDPISGDMAMIKYGGQELPIGINRIYMEPNGAGYTFTDTRGNPYDETRELINTTAGARIMPAQQLWLDPTPPTATTNLPSSTKGYEPITYASEEGGATFCIPVTVTDQVGDGENSMSLTNGVTGAFSWRGNAGETTDYSYQYAVTASAGRPADTAYQLGITGERYAFTQVDSGNYIHIRLLNDVDYNFASSELRIYPVDNAGNMGDVRLTLDYQVDRVGPKILRDGYRTEYLALNHGQIRSSHTITDVSEIIRVEYQWTAKGAGPAGEWSTVTSYRSGTTSSRKIFEVVRSDLAAGSKHQFTLHLKATDLFGQAAMVSFDYEYDLSLPTYNLDFVTNPNDPTARHSLKLWVPESGDQAATDLWVMVSYFNSPSDTPCRYIRRFKADQILGEAKAIDIFDVNTSVNGWEVCELGGWTQVPPDATNPTAPATKNAYKYWSWALSGEMKTDLYTRLRQWYGQETITIIARQIDDTYYEDMIFQDEPHAIDSFTYRFASDAKIGTNGKINNISVTPKTEVSYGAGATSGEVLRSLPDHPAMPRSLDGAVFTVTLGNAQIPNWDLADIDFSSPQTQFALYQSGNDASSTPLFSAPLIAKASQDITIPTGVATSSGSYKAVVSVRAKGSGHIDRAEYTNILIDRREIESYGIAKVQTHQAVDAQTLEAVTDYTLAPGTRPSEAFVSAAPDAVQSILFQTDLTSLQIGSQSSHAAYIRVWNETAGAAIDVDRNIPLDRYPWIYLPGQRQYNTSVLTSATKETILAQLGSTRAATAACIPILPGENLIKYQIALTSGYLTPVQTVIVRAGDQPPIIEITLSPDKIAGTATHGPVVASLRALVSSVAAPESLRLGLIAPSGVDGSALAEQFQQQRQVSLSANGPYTFYVFDNYHNFDAQQVSIDYIDTQGPSLAVTNLSDPSVNTFTFSAQIEDDLDTDSCQLYIQFDDAYSALLGVEPGTAFALPLSEHWSAVSIAQHGVYQLSTVASGGAKLVTFSGAFRYDKSYGTPTVERRITLYAADAAGNRSRDYTITLHAHNEPASYLSGALANGGFTATFSKPVLLRNPEDSMLAPVYAPTKIHLPFFFNGVYPISYSDIFGDTYDAQIEVNQFDGRYSCTVTISETAPTNQDVTVLINAAFNPDVTIVDMTGGDITPVHDTQKNVIAASIIMTENGTISFGIKPKDSSYPTQNRSVVVGNIDKVPPAHVELLWVYTSDLVDGLTAGEVTVSILADEEISPLADTGTTHTFTLDDQEPYTFHYADLAGNRGSITAMLPVKIVAQDSVELDITPPDYEFAVYQSVAGVSTKVAGYNRMEYDALVDKTAAYPVFSGVLQLRFKVYDENRTTLRLAGGPVPGVSVSGTTVTVAENAEFTVVITDSNENETTVPIRITTADNEAPTGEVTYVKTGPFSIRGYLSINDDRPGKVTLKNTSGVMVEMEPGPYHGHYYHDFLDNESFTFIFTDAAGNTGSVVAAVTSLDTSSPEAVISQWSPYFIDEYGEAHKGVLAATPTNSEVSVYIRFTKPIQSMTPHVLAGDLSAISVQQATDSAIVVFRQNAEVRLHFTAPNTRSGSIRLAVDIIDKTAPVIVATQTAGDARSVSYTFTADESVYLEGSERTFGTSFSREFELNGEYELRFTDQAGNTSTVRVTVSGIDRVAPSVSITGLPATKESVAAYNEANGTSLEHRVTNQSVTIHASLDEPGTIAFRGLRYPVDADQSVELQIDYNGIYEIAATDLVGMSTRYSFVIDCIDKTKPQILFSSSNLAVRQGTSATSFAAMALANVLVTDNDDPNPQIAITSSLTDSQLNTPGNYSITFTATDRAGNERTAVRSVLVYDQNALELWVNGALAQPSETLVIAGKGSRIVNVTVDNLPSGSGGTEPYQIYWKPGLNTPGQMKEATPFTGSFTAGQDGFYTLYLMTQSRASLITYLYLQS